MQIKPKLLLITNNYPYKANGGETMFVKPEISYLKLFFDVTVAPVLTYGAVTDTSEGIIIDTSLASSIHRSRILRLVDVFFSAIFYKEIFSSLRSKHVLGITDIIRYADLFLATRNWAIDTKITDRFDLLCTFWSTGATGGLISARAFFNVRFFVSGCFRLRC